MPELLALENVTAGYGDAVALEAVSLALEEGESLAVLGRNGVGKTTLLRTILGLTTFHSGEARFRGRNVAAMAPHMRAAIGIGWVPQERGMFASLSVEEHLTSVARPGPWTLDKVYELFPQLTARRANLGNRLSGGEQQMVAIGRALMLNPRLLLLDEPLEGLAPIVVQGLMTVIRNLVGQSGMAIVLVEQHARVALSLTRNVIVLERGRITHRSPSQELLQDDQLLRRLVTVA